MSTIAFRCRLEPDDGGYVVTFPDLPFGATEGETEAGALEAASDCLETILAVLVEEGKDIPKPSPLQPGERWVSPTAVTAAQVALYTAMRQEHLSVEMLASRLGLEPVDVKRLIDLSRYPPVEAIERALAVMGHRLTVALDAAE